MIERKCSCEMGMHRAPLEKYIIESGAINHLPNYSEITTRYIWYVMKIHTVFWAKSRSRY